MKKIKILTIWLLSLWLLGNIFLIVSAQGNKKPDYTELNRKISEAGKQAYEEIKNKQANDVQRNIDQTAKAEQDKANKIISKEAEKNREKLEEAERNRCKWIKLNTDFPFVGKCIGYETDGTKTNQINVFPKMIRSLMKLTISIIMLMSFLIIVISGVMITSSGYDGGNYKEGIENIKKVAIGLALLGASGVILKLINPNFFT